MWSSLSSGPESVLEPENLSDTVQRSDKEKLDALLSTNLQLSMEERVAVIARLCGPLDAQGAMAVIQAASPKYAAQSTALNVSFCLWLALGRGDWLTWPYLEHCPHALPAS
jgi:hypothetical protein